MKESEIANLADKGLPRARRINPERHARLCTICRHDRRKEIERDFLDWRSPPTCCRNTDFAPAPSSISTPTPPAFGPSAASPVLERLLERARHSRPSAAMIVRAFRMYTSLDDGDSDELPATAQSSANGRPGHRRNKGRGQNLTGTACHSRKIKSPTINQIDNNAKYANASPLSRFSHPDCGAPPPQIPNQNSAGAPM